MNPPQAFAWEDAMLARWLAGMVVVALPTIVGAQTNEAFRVDFSDTVYISTAERTQQFAVTVEFVDPVIRPRMLPLIQATVAGPTNDDPCGALVEMFQSVVFDEHTDRGVPHYNADPPKEGLFCFPTVFVGSTNFTPSGGPGINPHEGEWASPTYPPLDPATQLVPVFQMISHSEFDLYPGPTTTVPPLGSNGDHWPWADGPFPGSVRIFGPSGRPIYLVYEDCPSLAGIRNNVGIGTFLGTPVVGHTDQPLWYQNIFDTLFYVYCPDKAQNVLMLDWTWEVRPELVIGKGPVLTRQTSMLTRVWNVAVRPGDTSGPAVSNGPEDLHFRNWVLLR